MEFENLLKLVECVSHSDLDSFSYEQDGTKIKLKKHKRYHNAETTVSMAIENPARAEKVERQQGGKEVKSPLVGIFYAAPGEDAEPFVSVGDRVKKGDILGIVEAMKLMNEIESEYDGIVKEIVVENAESVEYGQTLFVIGAE
ncbi:MAG: acetyl-CoA carboxylase biotin carboxyl carrier protein [Lachnospiraceae bacterium]|nr:acetyl-CoA carboxylase biotin carboxyl carrier protein [Lachnospiraceae bacterium]